jgi:hypothetical protein
MSRLRSVSTLLLSALLHVRSKKAAVLIVCRWPPAPNSDQLHQLSAAIDTVPHLCPLMGYHIQSFSAYRIQTEGEPEGRVHSSGHRRRG